MSDEVDLEAVAAGWAPEPVTTRGSTDAWSVAAFSGLLDQPPAAGDGDPLPPLWHWFGFLDHPRSDELGDDGHPRDGHFLPPVPHRRRMVAGGRLEVTGTVRVGEELTRTSSLVRREVKHGRSGAMILATVRHELARDDGRRDRTVLATEEQDFAYRSQPPGAARGLAGDDPAGRDPDGDAADPGPEAVSLLADETVLFRFSALTHNPHRIHYDHPYATGVEGYPGLVVHGPLLALLLLEIPRRHHPDRAVTRFAYRLTRPAFARAVVTADHTTADHTTTDGTLDRLEGAAGVPGAPPSVTGTIELV